MNEGVIFWNKNADNPSNLVIPHKKVVDFCIGAHRKLNIVDEDNYPVEDDHVIFLNDEEELILDLVNAVVFNKRTGTIIFGSRTENSSFAFKGVNDELAFFKYTG